MGAFDRKSSALAPVGSGVMLASSIPVVKMDGATYIRSGVLALRSAYPRVPTDLGNEITDFSTRTVISGQWGAGAGGAGALVMHSKNTTAGIISYDNGKTWATATPTLASVQAMTYAAGLFISVGAAGCITSPDGVTWSTRTMPAVLTWSSLASGNGMIVAIPRNVTNTACASSPDGINWTARTLPTSSTWNSVAFGNGVFVATDGVSAVATSPDGINWTIRTAVLPAQAQLVAFGTATNTVMTSVDGIAWTPSRAGPSAAVTAISFGNGVFLAAVNGSNIAVSADGLNWKSRPGSVNTTVNGIGFGNGVFMLGGAVDTVIAVSNAAVGLYEYTPGLYLRVA